MVTVADRIESLVRRKPGLTEAQLAERLFGGDAYRQRVNSSCRKLIKQDRVQRRGKGGRADPYRYYVAGTHPRAGYGLDRIVDRRPRSEAGATRTIYEKNFKLMHYRADRAYRISIG